MPLTVRSTNAVSTTVSPFYSSVKRCFDTWSNGTIGSTIIAPVFSLNAKTDEKGKQKKVYRYENMMTPYDKFKSLPDAKTYLKPELSFEIMDVFAMRMSDNDCADKLQKERQKLFSLIHGQNRYSA